MKNKVHWLIINMILLAILTTAITINLNSRIAEQGNQIKDMQWTIQEHELSIQRLADQNKSQEVILNKLNREYQLQARKKAEELKSLEELQEKKEHIERVIKTLEH